MVKKTSPSPLRKIIIIVLILLCGVILFFTYRIWHYANIKPISESQTYYRDPFGTIYEDASTGCFDICFIREYKKLDVDIRTFTVLLVKSPFTSIHRNGEMTESRYAKDGSRVFWNARVISNADPASFTALSYDLARDSTSYYIYGTPLLTYLTNELTSADAFELDSLEVLSYSPSTYIVVRSDKRYYYVKLNPQPKNILEISQSEAVQYPPLQ